MNKTEVPVMKPDRAIGRRNFVKATAGMATMALAKDGKQTAGRARAGKHDNRIVQENAKPGTLEWQLQYTRFDDPITLASYPMNRQLRCSAIEGYCSKNSLLPGESIDFKVSMKPAGRFFIDIHRLGYYGGLGGRHMIRLGPFKGAEQPVPMMTVERLRECAWEKCATLTIPTDWPSGVYLGKLTRDEPYGAQSYLIFVIKESRHADLLFQASDTTWQAYNKWPGNDSLYDDGTPELWYQGPLVRVSFDRPYAKYCQVIDAPATIGSGSFLLWEFPLLFWLEQQGYDVTYCSNVDLDTNPEVLGRAKALLSVGHDEYYSRRMLDEALKARDAGLSIAFLSGNTAFRELVFYNSSITGMPCRAFARKRNFQGDEQQLLGVRSYGPGYGDWVITKADHWVYEGLEVRAGDRIPAIIGWEYHGTPASIPGLEVVAASELHPRSNELSSDQRHAAVVYPGAKGNWVFNAGTIWWPEGLSSPPGHIPARVAGMGGVFGVHPWVQGITANVLNRMINDSPRA
jgi:hypothetical protein